MKSIGGEPVQVPSWAVSVCVSRGVPVIVGTAVFTGGSGSTGADGSDDAVVEPPLFVAVTRTRIVAPTSAGVRS